MWRAVNRWFEENRWAGDAVLAGTLLVLLGVASLGRTVLTGNPYYSWTFGVSGARTVMTVALILPLFARRSYPAGVVVATVFLAVMQAVFIPSPVPGDAVVPIVVHAAAAYIPDRRWGRVALTVGLGGSVAAAVQWSGFPYSRQPGVLMTIFLACVAVVGVAYLLGMRQRERRERAAEQVASLAERNRLLTSERDTRVEMGAVAERARIARELHDIVAHSLSVIVVQADGGAAAARSRPEVGPEVLETIAATSRDALAQMRRMVSVLRTGGDVVPGYAPAPGPDDLPALTDQVRAAGLPVEFDVIGTPRELSADAGLAVYRSVQESLTNVLKHAGPAATCRVVLHYGPSEAVVTVTDDGRGASASFAEADDVSPTQDGRAAPPGHGLEGMRERVALQGGSVHAGPRIGGGFEVSASIPYADAGAQPGAAAGAAAGAARRPT